MNKSIWTDTTNMSTHKPLSHDIKTDVLIIGGGICGILCAYFLKNAGVKCVVVEGSTIASGITKNTTAKITSQHGLIYSKLLQKKGTTAAALYLKTQEKALREYKKISEGIDCDFEIRDAYVYSLTDRKKIEDELNALRKIGFSASFKDEIELPFKIAGAVCFPDQAQFNPLKFISKISKTLEIYENTFVYEMLPHKAVTKNGTITYNTAIVTTHFPFINKHGSYFLKLYQERSYVSAYKNAQKLNGMYIDESSGGLSFRSYKDTLFIGGNNHRTGKSSSGWKPLYEFAQSHYPESELSHSWATQDCISLDSMPYIGHYSKQTPDLYVATGFNKWGMTNSMLSAMILTDMIKGRKNDFADLFSPQRSILTPQLMTNSFEAVLNLITPSKKHCPHLGCALKWNKNEHTWDCPCHGSRFEKGGKLIDNPSTGDMK